MKYRAEIDGLRAIAVVPVMLYHGEFELFSGGFIGVDVFFVISGFLIASILIDDMDKSRFSIIKFYERRARRILPALFLVVLTTMPFAWHMMLPDPFENYAQSVVATVFFSNNILLSLTSGYWDLASEFKPLLHTWSLGVEEQFYIFIPMVMLLAWRHARRQAPLIIAAFAMVSFVWCQVAMARDSDLAFYMMHTRAWELLAGSVAAYLSRRYTPANRDLPSALGVACILIAIFGFSEATPFPSYTALLPVTGTVLVLYFARQGGLVARLLSLRPMVGIGLISYSLYLWHQPIFAFARIGSYAPLTPANYVLLILLTFALSYLSWRFVESPFRNPARVSTRTLAVGSVSGGAVLSAAALSIYFAGGMPSRFFDLDRFDSADAYISYNMRVHQLNRTSFPEGDAPDVVVIGNSQARDFVNMLIESGEAENFDIVYLPGYHVCDPARQSQAAADAVAHADALIFVSYSMDTGCWERIESGLLLEKEGALLFVGPKQFGYNLNAFIRVPRPERASARSQVLPEVVKKNQELAEIIPPPYYLDILHTISKTGDQLPVFDEDGLLVSADRVHVTRQGARLLGARLFDTTVWAAFLERARRSAYVSLDTGSH